jgi:hypothetical protein
MTWFRCMLENVMAACRSILVPARILEHPTRSLLFMVGMIPTDADTVNTIPTAIMTPNGLQILPLGA